MSSVSGRGPWAARPAGLAVLNARVAPRLPPMISIGFCPPSTSDAVLVVFPYYYIFPRPEFLTSLYVLADSQLPCPFASFLLWTSRHRGALRSVPALSGPNCLGHCTCLSGAQRMRQPVFFCTQVLQMLTLVLPRNVESHTAPSYVLLVL